MTDVQPTSSKRRRVTDKLENRPEKGYTDKPVISSTVKREVQKNVESHGEIPSNVKITKNSVICNGGNTPKLVDHTRIKRETVTVFPDDGDTIHYDYLVKLMMDGIYSNAMLCCGLIHIHTRRETVDMLPYQLGTLIETIFGAFGETVFTISPKLRFTLLGVIYRKSTNLVDSLSNSLTLHHRWNISEVQKNVESVFNQPVTRNLRYLGNIPGHHIHNFINVEKLRKPDK